MNIYNTMIEKKKKEIVESKFPYAFFLTYTFPQIKNHEHRDYFATTYIWNALARKYNCRIQVILVGIPQKYNTKEIGHMHVVAKSSKRFFDRKNLKEFLDKRCKSFIHERYGYHTNCCGNSMKCDDYDENMNALWYIVRHEPTIPIKDCVFDGRRSQRK